MKWKTSFEQRKGKYAIFQEGIEIGRFYFIDGNLKLRLGDNTYNIVEETLFLKDIDVFNFTLQFVDGNIHASEFPFSQEYVERDILSFKIKGLATRDMVYGAVLGILSQKTGYPIDFRSKTVGQYKVSFIKDETVDFVIDCNLTEDGSILTVEDIR